MTIDGDTNGDNVADITISGGGTTRIFEQSGTTTDVALLSLTLTGGSAAIGGAIYASYSGSLVIQDTTLMNNVASNKGGAIYTYRTNLSLSSSLLLNNSAFNGGAMYIDGVGLHRPRRSSTLRCMAIRQPTMAEVFTLISTIP